MRGEVLAGVLLAALLGAGAAWAEAAGQLDAEPDEVPTVTIINKAPGGAEMDEPNALSIVEETEAAGLLPERAPEKAADGDGIAEVQADGGIPTGEAIEAAKADVAQPPPLTPTLHIDIDLTAQTLSVSEEGTVRHTWPISSGRRGYATPTGTYKPTWMARQWFSRQYDNAPMPHSIFFHRGIAIHGSFATRSLGRPASHGCVRLLPKNAATLFRLVTRHGKERTRIVVHGTPDFGPVPAVASREPRTRRATHVPRMGPYTYLPPAAAGRGASSYNARVSPRARRRAGQAQAYYPPRPPRGLFTGYGF